MTNSNDTQYVIRFSNGTYNLGVGESNGHEAVFKEATRYSAQEALARCENLCGVNAIMKVSFDNTEGNATVDIGLTSQVKDLAALETVVVVSDEDDEEFYDTDILAQLQRAMANPPEDWSSWYELIRQSHDEIVLLRAAQ